MLEFRQYINDINEPIPIKPITNRNQKQYGDHAKSEFCLNDAP